MLQRRSRVARRIFVENAALGVPEHVLPLAMIAMDRGVIQWLDVFLVRREVGMEHGSILGLGFAPRALREAHVLQYLSQLSEVITERNNSNRGQSFPHPIILRFFLPRACCRRRRFIPPTSASFSFPRRFIVIFPSFPTTNWRRSSKKVCYSPPSISPSRATNWNLPQS